MTEFRMRGLVMMIVAVLCLAETVYHRFDRIGQILSGLNRASQYRNSHLISNFASICWHFHLATQVIWTFTFSHERNNVFIQVNLRNKGIRHSFLTALTYSEVCCVEPLAYSLTSYLIYSRLIHQRVYWMSDEDYWKSQGTAIKSLLTQVDSCHTSRIASHALIYHYHPWSIPKVNHCKVSQVQMAVGWETCTCSLPPQRSWVDHCTDEIFDFDAGVTFLYTHIESLCWTKASKILTKTSNSISRRLCWQEIFFEVYTTRIFLSPTGEMRQSWATVGLSFWRIELWLSIEKILCALRWNADSFNCLNEHLSTIELNKRKLRITNVFESILGWTQGSKCLLRVCYSSRLVEILTQSRIEFHQYVFEPPYSPGIVCFLFRFDPIWSGQKILTFNTKVII